MRKKENRKYWNNRMSKLFKIDSDFQLIKKRYDALKLILQEEYPYIKEHDNIQFLKDIVYLDRLLRKNTEHLEKEEKKILSQETQIEMGFDPLTRQHIAKLKTL